MTTWYPDTCDCVIEISDEPATRGQPVRHIRKCSVHQNHDHNQVLAENRGKNAAVAAFEKKNPGVSHRWNVKEDRSFEIIAVD